MAISTPPAGGLPRNEANITARESKNWKAVLGFGVVTGLEYGNAPTDVPGDIGTGVGV